MAHPGIFAIIVGVAIGTAIYYYLNSENAQTHQYSRERDSQSSNDYSRYNPNNALEFATAPRRRRRNSNYQCVICFETITLSSMRKLDSCGHEFHCRCITKWLKEKKDCPICRTAVI